MSLTKFDHNTNILENLSVIIPFTESDLAWKDLLQDLKTLPQNSEVLLVGPTAPNSDILKRASEGVICKIRYVTSDKGRAVQLNTGARLAENCFLWFLHADSKVPRPSIHWLEKELLSKPNELHYFNLHFLNDGPRAVGINSIFANLRSKYLGMPFGDQGFAMSRAVFFRIGGFSQYVPYGEDHVLTWEAKRKRIRLNNIPASIFTSARRYKSTGWTHLTSLRLYLTYKQAAVEGAKLVKQRLLEMRSN